MSEKIEDGGPAFPIDEKNHDGTHFHCNTGLSMRDYFAAAALQGMLSSDVYMREIDGAAEQFVGDDGWRPTDPQKKQAQINVVSRTAFDLADAMLAARRRS